MNVAMKKRKVKMIKRIKKYFFLKRLGIKKPFKASGDKNFIQMGN